MKTVKFDHSINCHSKNGPTAALPLLFPKELPESVIDIGCGIGAWLNAFKELNVLDIWGVDGVQITGSDLLIAPNKFLCKDLSSAFNLERKFDLAICFEVAEHLDERYAKTIINNIVNHSEQVLFSAASPLQFGQNHINCQWPNYWQAIFNNFGYVCYDWPRWAIWSEKTIEPWYRQNMFMAELNPKISGKEKRISPVIHPDMVPFIPLRDGPLRWHLRRIPQAFLRTSAICFNRVLGYRNF